MNTLMLLVEEQSSASSDCVKEQCSWNSIIDIYMCGNP